ncbi:MAG TPA: hypothetical protein DCQ64_25450 [Candidatus Rokubacteria bacterium]|nr:hypothetical protein [Candidatus Rokubacteria bacterium]
MSEIGWGWPLLSRKAHIFDGARSLCSGWLYMGKVDPFVASDKPGPDDCKACWRKAAKLPPPPEEPK